MILRNLKMSQMELSNLQWIALYLEYIGDEIKRIAKFLANTKIDDKEKETLKGILEDIERSYLTAMTSYYKEHKEGLFQLMKEKYSILEKCEKLAQKSSNQKMYGLCERIKMMYSSVHNILKILTY